MKQQQVIQVIDLSFGYTKSRIFERLNFSLNLGQHVAIIGDNGSGKSTLIKIILGVLDGYQGQIKIFGKPISKFKDWHKIGYVPQNPINSLRDLPITVREMLVSAYLGVKLNNENLKEAIQRVSKITNINQIQDKLVSELSGGQIQRTIIARSLINKPQILILDEPTNGIDPETRTSFLQILTRLKQEEKLTIIQITHDLDRITDLVDQVMCIQENEHHQYNKNLIHIHQ